MFDKELYEKKRGDKVYFVYDTPVYISRDKKSIRIELEVTSVRGDIIYCKSETNRKHKFYLSDGSEMTDYWQEAGHIYSSKEFYELSLKNELSLKTKDLRKELIEEITSLNDYEILRKIKILLKQHS